MFRGGPLFRYRYREQPAEHSDMVFNREQNCRNREVETGLMQEIDGLLAVAGFRRVRDRFYGDLYCREESSVRHGISIGAGIYVPNVLEAAVGGEAPA